LVTRTTTLGKTLATLLTTAMLLYSHVIV